MKTIFIILFLLCAYKVNADEISVPFECYPKELKQEFKLKGLKLDINSIDKTENSWGYLINKGDSFVIYTYKDATQEDFYTIQKIVFEIEKRHKNG